MEWHLIEIKPRIKLTMFAIELLLILTFTSVTLYEETRDQYTPPHTRNGKLSIRNGVESALRGRV